jgi:predicted PurR-regulated permease PerM
MKAVKKIRDDPPAEAGRTKDIDSGELRAIVIAAGALAVTLYFIKLILLPFVLAGIIGYICTPLLDWLAARTRWPRLLFAVVLFVLVMVIAGGIATFAAERLLAQARGLSADLQSVLENFITQVIGQKSVVLFGQQMNAHQMAQQLLTKVGEWLGQSGHILALVGYGIGGLMGVFLTAVLLFYFLVSGRRLARGILWIAPPHRRHLIERIWARLNPILLRYFLGVLAIIVYTSTAAYVGLGVILGINHALLLALLTGILETIPVVGPAAAAIIAGLVAVRSATGIMSIVAYALYATALRLSIDQLLGPIVLGRAAHVHPVLIIFCFLAGGLVFGIPGVILAVPVALLIRSTLETLYGPHEA